MFTKFVGIPCRKKLFNEEIEALKAVLDEILDLFGERPNKGTIVLDGQKKGETASLILRMNLEDGAYRRVFFGTLDRTSDDLANESIERILSWPEKDAYDHEGLALQFGEMPTGVYSNMLHGALVLNTTFGRFVVSMHLALERQRDDGSLEFRDGYYYNEVVAAMKGLAVALGQMGLEDPILQQSVRKLLDRPTQQEVMISSIVSKMFYTCELPELKAWKEWHEKADDGRLELFFQ